MVDSLVRCSRPHIGRLSDPLQLHRVSWHNFCRIPQEDELLRDLETVSGDHKDEYGGSLPIEQADGMVDSYASVRDLEQEWLD